MLAFAITLWKALRREPVGVLGPDERFRNDHMVGKRLLPGGDLLPDPVAGRETLIGRVQTSIDADLAEAPKLVGFHVLDAEPHANGPEPLGNICQGEAPRGVVLRAVVDQLDHSLIIAIPRRVLLGCCEDQRSRFR